jgi:hypothetical protein
VSAALASAERPAHVQTRQHGSHAKTAAASYSDSGTNAMIRHTMCAITPQQRQSQQRQLRRICLVIAAAAAAAAAAAVARCLNFPH